MAQIDSYIKRVRMGCNLSFLDDIFELYEFIPNEDLRQHRINTEIRIIQ